MEILVNSTMYLYKCVRFKIKSWKVRSYIFARLCKIMIRISVERMSETFGRLLRVTRGRRTRKSKLSRLISMRVSRYCLLTKFLMRIYDNEWPIEDYPLLHGRWSITRIRGSQCSKYVSHCNRTPFSISPKLAFYTDLFLGL